MAALTAVLALLAVFCHAPTPAFADEPKPLRGIALVVGESRYEHLTALPNPANDARAVARLLGDLGFEVASVADGDRARLDKALDRFIEDAADADVALLYYSGHGIEAGGENFLVPVDADVSSLADAAHTLVPLSGPLARLKAAAPVAIVLLDACRTSPFPPGASVATAAGAAPVAAAGLALARGAAPLADAAGAPRSLGEVVGFAAAPGQAALDGDPGGNSPYAAALLKHLAAGGFDFGDVMTMVAEEVYVKTGGRQLPWTNASLRRLLYFGLAPEETQGDEAAIRSERRKLLLTIAATPADTRAMVETVAARNAVPLDALYGMLKVLEVDTSGGRQDLQAQLSAGAEKLARIIAQRDMQAKQDPELIRLSNLAQQAQDEGAIALALQFRARASDRALEIDKALDEAEADIKARRLELAETFADHAKTAILNFDYRTAAARYEDAFKQTERWDADAAFFYKIAQAGALTDQGMVKGDNPALSEAIAVYEQAKLLPGLKTYFGGAAGIAVDEGITLTALAERDNGEKGARWLAQAIAGYEDALARFSPRRAPTQRASVQINLGNAYNLMGERAGGTAYYKKSLAAFRQAIRVFTKKADPDAWAGLQNNIGSELTALGAVGDGRRNYSEAIKAFQAALTVWKRETQPVQWAMAESNLGSAYRAYGELMNDIGSLHAAVDALSAVLEVRTRTDQPMDWAGGQNNLGSALLSLGQRGQGVEYFERAIEAFGNARFEITRERDPFNWAAITYNTARAFKFMADGEDSLPRYRQALETIDLALTELRRDKSPEAWGRATSVRGEILFAIGSRIHDRATLEQARQAYLDARDVFRAQDFTTHFEDFYARQIKLIDAEVAKAN